MMQAVIYKVKYRIALTDAQQVRLDRKWPDGDPFISYEKISSLLEPLPVEDVYWSHHTGQFLYFTVRGDDIDGTVAEVVDRLETKLGTA